MSINRVNRYPISQLFDTESRIVFEIPKYQRAYTWSSKNWENVFDDLLDNSTGYFLGTIICIDTAADSINSPKMEVVDGQQRLTTLSLLLASLYSVLSEFRNELNDDQKLDMRQLKCRLVLKDTKSAIRVVPQMQDHNLDDYKGILAEQEIISPHPMPKSSGKRRIKRAFEYFKKRIGMMIETSDNGAPNCAIKSLFELLGKINSAIIVMIEVSSHADAHTLFESLNNRGVPLTAVDLIKNLLLAQLDTKDNESLDYHFSRWQQILKYIGDDYSVQERFLRHNYNAFRRVTNAPFKGIDDSRQYPLGILATRSNLLDIYEKLIKRDPASFLGTLFDNASCYSKIILRNDDDIISTELHESYQNLSRVQGAPSYLLLLYMEKERNTLGITDDDIIKTVTLLVSFFVRRNLTDIPPTRDLTRIFMDIIEEIENDKLRGNIIYNNMRKKLVSLSAPDSVFEERLRGPVYSDNYDATRFILCTIAERGMTKETKVDLWQQTINKQYDWTIEHIFPQGENIPKKWIDMIANGDVEKAKDYQEKYVNTFGNLTLTGYNSELSNRPFIEKREQKDKDGLNNGYRNGLNLNADVVTCDEWTIDKINKRTDRLVREILSAFAL